ncbi:MAG: metallophosphoesterase, partial [Planctomycetales bacterium]
MRVLAIGDVHGCLTALRTLEHGVPFRPDDQIVTLGDYVDRGPNSHGVVDWLIHRMQARNLIPLRGNHEIMMLGARDDPTQRKEWLRCGGDATLASYSPLEDAGKLADVPDEHWEFFQRDCRDWHETETHFFVHANAYPDCPLAQQPEYMLFWERFENPAPHESGKIMVCGHSSQKSGRPNNRGHAVCV